MKIKIPIRITTTISHTDNPKDPLHYLAERYTETEIEVEIPEDSVKVFRQLWMINSLTVTISGTKSFKDGEEIA